MSLLNIWEAKQHFTLKKKIEIVTPSQYNDIPENENVVRVAQLYYLLSGAL